MHIVALTFGTIILFSMECTSDKKCYIARICIHNAAEKCGRNSTGVFRRFLDTCDLLEYNCLYNTDYEKVSPEHCEDLPPIPPKDILANQTESQQNTTSK